MVPETQSIFAPMRAAQDRRSSARGPTVQRELHSGETFDIVGNEDEVAVPLRVQNLFGGEIHVDRLTAAGVKVCAFERIERSHEMEGQLGLGIIPG